MLLYFSEYRQGIGTADVIISLPRSDPLKPSVRLDIGDADVVVQRGKDVLLRGKLPFKFIRGEHNPVVTCEEGLVCIHFSRQSVVPIELTALTVSPQKSSKEDFIAWVSERTHVPYTIKCSFCGHILSKDGSVFSKVFPLPTEGFHEFASSLFCHGESPAVQRVIAGDFLPGANEGFLSATQMILRSNDLNLNHILTGDFDSSVDAVSRDETKRPFVQCSRCLATVGNLKKHKESPSGSSKNDAEAIAVVLFRWEKVLLQTKGHPMVGCLSDSCRSLSLLTVEKMSALVESTGRFRFLLKDSSLRAYACLWYMNTKVLLCTNSLATKSESEHGPLCELELLSKEASTNTNPFKATKIMFKNLLRDNNVLTGASWALDTTVESLVLEECECIRLLETLEESCTNLPPSMREANTFYIGYLNVY